mmetsp:Transcript_21524/g.50175  ORF Transcript_21524/g.50175 Transcript_21524/m.50175 type:complete len:426 (+) Transcript_21524:108-1385(+)
MYEIDTANAGDDNEQEEEEEVEVPEQFECSICMKLLLEPITVACGHTFCKACLDQSLGYRSVCAVCRAPITSGQGVNVLIKSIIANDYPKALRQRIREQEQELARGEDEAVASRRREAQRGSGGDGRVLLPLLFLPSSSMPWPCAMPYCKVVMEAPSAAAHPLIQHALEGGRRIGIIEGDGTFDEDARPMGVCLDILGVERPPERPMVLHLMGKFRFWLVERPDLHDQGFMQGRCEAFFDEPIPVGQLMPAAEDATDENMPDLAKAALADLERQLVSVGPDGRRAFSARHGDVPAIGAGASTSAEMERLSFWLTRSVLCSKDEMAQWLAMTDTRARLEFCRRRLHTAGTKPVLDLPGAGSFMHPGQSALGSLALLVVVIAILVAKAMGLFDEQTPRRPATARGGSAYEANAAAAHDAWVLFQMFR